MELLKKFGQKPTNIIGLVVVIITITLYWLTGSDLKPDKLLTSLHIENWIVFSILLVAVVGGIIYLGAKTGYTTLSKLFFTDKYHAAKTEQAFKRAKPEYTTILDQYTRELNIIGAPETLTVLSLKNLVSMAFTISDRENKKAVGESQDQEDSHNKTINDIFNKLITLNTEDTSEEPAIKPLVITGEPGSGKTSLIKYLCQHFINKPTKGEERHLETNKPFFPLYLPLSAWNEALEETNSEASDTTSVTDLARRLSRFYSVDKSITVTSTLFQKWLDEEVNILLLLDGLDEVNHQFIEQACKDIAYYWSSLRKKPLIIITSRILAYEQYQDQLPKHWQARVQPIVSLDEQKLFAKEIFSALNNDDFDVEQIEKQTEQFSEQLKGEVNRSLATLCQWPFLLQAMAVLWLHNKTSNLPQNRAALYFALMKLLLQDHDAIKERPFTTVIRRWFTDAFLPQHKMSLMDHLHILGSVALSMIQKNTNHCIKITDLDALLFELLKKEKPDIHLKQLGKIVKDYRLYLTKRAQLLKQPSKQSANLMFAHKSLLDYSAAWKMRHLPYNRIQLKPQEQIAISTYLDGLNNQFLLNAVFADYKNADFTSHDSEAQQQHPWYEVFQFYTQIPDSSLSDEKDADDYPERLESLIPSTQIWVDLLQTALSEAHWQTLSQNKHFELYFYALFNASPNLSDAIFHLGENNEQSLMGVEDLVKDNDPGKIYVLLYALQSISSNRVSVKVSIQQLQQTIAEMLSQWLASQTDQLPDFSQSPKNERKAYIYRLALHKAEALIREYRPELLPDWAKNMTIDQISSEDLFTEKVKRFVNPDECNAEYLFIPGGEFPAYEDGGPWIDEGLAAHQRTEPYYLARYPVTFRQYRYFIDYLALEEHELHRYLTPDDFIQRLKDFAEDCDNNNDKSGFVQHLQKQERYADSLRSDSESNQHVNGDDQPVCDVNWYGVSSYCFWLSSLYIAKQKGVEGFLSEPLETLLNLFRLPHEAEWYWAAGRPVDDNKSGMKEYCWTNRLPMDDECGEAKRYQQVANYGQNIGKTTQVGLYPLGGSTEGLMDMSGNLWEWQSNWVKGGLWGGPALRGGSWSYRAELLPCSVRYNFFPRNRPYNGGFSSCVFPVPF